MDKIGNFEFDAMIAPNGVPSIAYAEQEESRPGIDGYDFLIMGKRSEDFLLRTVSHFRTLTQANAAVKSYELAAGTFQNVTFAQVQYSQVRIRSVRPNTPQRLIMSSSGDKYRVETEWIMKRTA